MRVMSICASLGLVAILATGCTQGLAIGQKQLGDLDRWLEQNHGERYDIRAKAKQAVDYAYNVCMFQATTKQICVDAIDRAELTISFLEDHYPDLVSVGSIKKGATQLNRLQKLKRAKTLEELDTPLSPAAQ